MRMMGLFRRTLGYEASLKAKRVACICVVRSILSYATIVRSPNNKQEIKRLENVQKVASRFITGNRMFDGVSYMDRCVHCGIIPLSYLREQYDLVLLYTCNCLHGKFNINADQ